jgi:hypothetical protein
VNPPEYGGSQVADQQRAAYPDVKPLVLQMDAGQAFDRALMVVRDLGWDVVADDRSSGRIEAVDTTFWFDFQTMSSCACGKRAARGSTCGRVARRRWRCRGTRRVELLRRIAAAVA